jgi:para-nitrobenzyl esterase
MTDVRPGGLRRIGTALAAILLIAPAMPLSARDASAHAPEVRTAAGTLAGTREDAQGTALRVFRGIPYAAAPTGARRWRAPQPPAAWRGVREARRFGPRCM